MVERPRHLNSLQGFSPLGAAQYLAKRVCARIIGLGSQGVKLTPITVKYPKVFSNFDHSSNFLAWNIFQIWNTLQLHPFYFPQDHFTLGLYLRITLLWGRVKEYKQTWCSSACEQVLSFSSWRCPGQDSHCGPPGETEGKTASVLESHSRERKREDHSAIVKNHYPEIHFQSCSSSSDPDLQSKGKRRTKTEADEYLHDKTLLQC